MSLEYTCDKQPSVTYRLRGKGWWAHITIREWPEGGSIGVQSDYGDYAYTWRSIGEEPFRKFLLDLDQDYFMRKAMGGGYYKFSPENTVVAIRLGIIDLRRMGCVEKEMARKIWDALAHVDSTTTVDSFALAMGDDWDTIAYKLYAGPQEIPWRDSPDTQAVNFWDIIWPCACEVWRKELEEEAACSSPS